jgi:hypothetical protein
MYVKRLRFDLNQRYLGKPCAETQKNARSILKRRSGCSRIGILIPQTHFIMFESMPGSPIPRLNGKAGNHDHSNGRRASATPFPGGHERRFACPNQNATAASNCRYANT